VVAHHRYRLTACSCRTGRLILWNEHTALANWVPGTSRAAWTGLRVRV